MISVENKQRTLNQEVFNMDIFKTLGDELSCKDVLQLGAAFSVAHVNYNKSPVFNGIDSKDMAKNSRKDSLSSKEKFAGEML